MSSSRKDFLKKVCVSGACLCGFNALTKANEDTPETGNQLLVQEWIAAMLESISHEPDEAIKRRIIKKIAEVHYKNLKMDDMLTSYEGKLDDFIIHIQQQWGWKIDYNKADKVLLADENKNYCVCPISEMKKGINISAMCYCSEGFAEKMFGKVAQTHVEARVIKSIRKGDHHCVYEIKIL